MWDIEQLRSNQVYRILFSQILLFLFIPIIPFTTCITTSSNAHIQKSKLTISVISSTLFSIFKCILYKYVKNTHTHVGFCHCLFCRNEMNYTHFCTYGFSQDNLMEISPSPLIRLLFISLSGCIIWCSYAKIYSTIPIVMGPLVFIFVIVNH